MEKPANRGFSVRLDRRLDRICEPLALAGGIGCLATILLVVFEAINRYGGLSSITLAEEYTGYLLVFVTALAGGSSFRAGLFPRLEFLLKAFPKRVKEILNLLGCITGLLVNGVYLKVAWGLFQESLRLHATSWTTLYTPLAIPQAIMVAGFVIFEIVLLGVTIKMALELKGK